MRLQHILALALLQVIPILAVQAQSSNESSANNLTTAENVTDIGTSEISTLADECGSWIGILLASDLDASNGLSASEYHKFLSSIEEPPYIAEYFREITSFNQLAWVFRAVHKSLACHCQRIGMGAGCCTGADAEVLLSGLGVSRKTFDIATTESVDEEYVAFFCQQIDYVLTTSVFSPPPTSRPFTLESSAPSPAGETSNSQSVSLTPSVHATVEPVSKVIFAEGASEQEQDYGLGTGEIVGIAIAVFLAFTFVIALVSYRHKSLERARLSKPLESNILDADIESTPAIALDLEVTPDHEESLDDNCLAPRVVSEITPFADDEIEADSELHTLSIFESVSSQLELDPSHLESIPSQLELVLSPVESVPSHLELETDSEIEEEEEEDDESYASSVWSESDAGESGINYNNCASTLAALGTASTVTAKLMANSCSENA